jgi:ectoine hydroxylase-related dioxygenase (phytanoyl-CoA dioxygenase family)
MTELSDFLESNDALADDDELRHGMERDGYLFFRGLVDADSILQVRRDILALCQKAGWLAEGTTLMDGIANTERTCVEPSPDYMAVYNEVMKLESFHMLAHDVALLAMLRHLIGEEVLAHPRNIARIVFPQNELYTTPAHQDWIHVQGTPETYTAWIPLCDCPPSLGNLVVLVGSHRLGILPTHRAYGAGGRGIDTERLGLTWAGGDFRLGDVLIFHSHTVHKALPNQDPQRLRLSVDFRYQGASQPITQGSLLPHFAQVTWEEVYAHWRSAERQYYWQKYPLNVVPFDRDHPGRRDADSSKM